MSGERLSVLSTFPLNGVDELVWLNGLKKYPITSNSHHAREQDVQLFLHAASMLLAKVLTHPKVLNFRIPR